MSSIAILTGTRADYGLLRVLIWELQKSQMVKVITIVTGTHFSEEFGNSYLEIVSDGIPITHRVDILTSTDSPLAVAQSTGVALSKIAEALKHSEPDLLVVLGDRYEAFAAASAAFLLQIPIAHIAGGEKTTGALDDVLRHCITKMSSLHFTSAEEYKNRVIQLGESSNSVFNVGAIGLDNFEQVTPMSIEQLSEFVDFHLSTKEFILCTIHPETTSSENVRSFWKPIEKALDAFPDIKIMITKANADAGGRQLNTFLEQYTKIHPNRVKLVSNLGQRAYISALKHSLVVLGNSSSGILEAPTAGTPTVNIGERQSGRLRASSVIDTANVTEDIISSIKTAMSPKFQKLAREVQSPYGQPGASAQIAKILSSVDLKHLLPKEFIDLEKSN